MASAKVPISRLIGHMVLGQFQLSGLRVYQGLRSFLGSVLLPYGYI